MKKTCIARLTCALLFVLGVHTSTGSARADSQERRPGLWGEYSQRQLTQPHNSLGLVAGPLQTPLFGQRVAGFAPDGGLVAIESNRPANGGTRDEVSTRVGVVFGLFPHFEAGALFLSFRDYPDFHYADFPVYLTYSWTFDHIDVGARLSFITPVESSGLAFNPSVPLLIRLNHARLDTGVFVPIQTGSGGAIGLNIPIRATFNLTPRWFVGAETGIYEAAFGKGAGLSSNLGGSVGYTTIFGKRLVDFALRFNWDDLIHYAPADDQKAIDGRAFQVFAGLTFHSKVM